MHGIGETIQYIGYATLFIAWVWVIGAATSKSIVWGVLCLFVPVATIAFAVVYWNIAKKPFYIWCLGVAVTSVGFFLRT